MYQYDLKVNKGVQHFGSPYFDGYDILRGSIKTIGSSNLGKNLKGQGLNELSKLNDTEKIILHKQVYYKLVRMISQKSFRDTGCGQLKNDRVWKFLWKTNVQYFTNLGCYSGISYIIKISHIHLKNITIFILIFLYNFCRVVFYLSGICYNSFCCQLDMIMR